MSEWIKSLFVSIFGANSELATIFISMIPIVELRGAIPFGSSTSFWGDNALELWESFLYSVLGSTIVCVILTFLFWPIFNWLKKTKWFKKLAEWIERKLKRNSENIENKAQAEKDSKRKFWLKIIGIFAFVAVPLPLTGVWTGTCLALFIGLSKRQTMLTVSLGNLVAGGLMLLITYFFKDDTTIVFYGFFILVAIFILYEVIRSIIKKVKNKKNESNHIQKEGEENLKEADSNN